jgi:predicted enzyme related to lactoylglutathione lyase
LYEGDRLVPCARVAAVTGIAFTMYPVTEMLRAVSFYRDVLGLTTGEVASDFWTEFEIGALSVP